MLLTLSSNVSFVLKRFVKSLLTLKVTMMLPPPPRRQELILNTPDFNKKCRLPKKQVESRELTKLVAQVRESERGLGNKRA